MLTENVVDPESLRSELISRFSSEVSRYIDLLKDDEFLTKLKEGGLNINDIDTLEKLLLGFQSFFNYCLDEFGEIQVHETDQRVVAIGKINDLFTPVHGRLALINVMGYFDVSKFRELIFCTKNSLTLILDQIGIKTIKV